jgi:hypothetical protein
MNNSFLISISIFLFPTYIANIASASQALALKRETIILKEGEIAQCAFKGSDRSRYSSSSGNLRYVSGDVKFKCALIKISKNEKVDARFISSKTVDLKCRKGLPMMMMGMPIKRDANVIGYKLSCVDSPQ